MKTIITEIPSRQDLFEGSNALDIGYPWLTFGAILALEYLLEKKDFKILEIGSGGSTIFFSQRCQKIDSFETKYDWYEKVKMKSNLLNLTNINIQYKTEDEIIEIIKEYQNNYYDLVLIDSYKTTSKNQMSDRKLLAEISIPKIKNEGWLIIDNYMCFNNNNFDDKNFEVYTFDEINYIGKGTKFCKKII